MNNEIRTIASDLQMVTEKGKGILIMTNIARVQEPESRLIITLKWCQVCKRWVTKVHFKLTHSLSHSHSLNQSINQSINLSIYLSIYVKIKGKKIFFGRSFNLFKTLSVNECDGLTYPIM